MSDVLARNLANNIQLMRQRQRLSQAQLASRAAIPRSTLTNIESGAGNPSLRNLAAVADALNVSIEELLSRPRDDCQLIKSSSLRPRRLGGGDVLVYTLLPESIRGTDLERIELAAGATMRGTAHIAGTKEYLHGLSGRIDVLLAGQLFPVRKGDVLSFPGDQAHSYLNRGQQVARAISLVVPVPLST